MSNLTYETVLDQALALSPEDRARLINQLTAQEHSLENGPSAQAADINSDAVEYLPPQHHSTPKANDSLLSRRATTGRRPFVFRRRDAIVVSIAAWGL